jgi:hypothetical protein
LTPASGQTENQAVDLDIHVFATEGPVEDGRLNFGCHTLATLRFGGVEAIVLDGFGPQNVLEDPTCPREHPRTLFLGGRAVPA